ncbi:MAG: hypothetical protein K6E96_05825 [Bacteroidales bacterium]|nr:hypothetical protein [Bacteroidales bacterium]
MISYEQSWRDYNGTLALKNNTNEEIRNVIFTIIYTDMSDNELDYKEFSKNVSIAPGMTKKLDITAYEHDRSYHYYKSEGLYDNTSFKIKFQLKDYNVNSKEIQDSNPGTWAYSFIAIIFILIILSIVIGLYVLVAVMAKKRNRSVVLWVLLSIIATPLLMIIILLCIGKDEKEIINKPTL